MGGCAEQGEVTVGVLVEDSPVMVMLGDELDDERFVQEVGEQLASLHGVAGVALGGSRATGRGHRGSDWDLGVYVNDGFEVAAARELVTARGWSGYVAERGEWGEVVDGGAWLEIEGRKVDLLWRDLAGIRRLEEECDRGVFRVVRIPFHVAGIATYVPIGELSVNIALVGEVPVGLPMSGALRERASAWWRENARLDHDYAVRLASRGGAEDALAGALLLRALIELAHARRCHEGAWVLNEKGLLADAGLAAVADRVRRVPDGQEAACAEVGDLLR